MKPAHWADVTCSPQKKQLHRYFSHGPYRASLLPISSLSRELAGHHGSLRPVCSYHAAAPAMDAVLSPLSIGGGLSVSISVRAAIRTTSAPGLSPSRYRGRRRLRLLATGSEEGQMRMYEASCDGRYEFRCDIDEEARKLAEVPGVLSVQPDMGHKAENHSHSSGLSTANLVSISDGASNHSSSTGKNEFWLVRMEKPGVEVVTKAQMVDHYTQILMKVLGNEQDAQVSIYHVSWERDYGFCCHIDEECAEELADVPGVLSVQPDMNFGSENKDYKGADNLKSSERAQVPDVKTKRLFVTGLSFYTSEKTLRAAFEPFGELVEVKIIMDKISKRSKGYAFIEYTTEEAGGAALKAMNGQIINGWMIVVDVAKTRSRDNQSGRPNQTFRPHFHTRRLFNV